MDRDYEKGIEYSKLSLEGLASIYGPRSQRLSSKYYQIANSLLILQRKQEAIETIEKCVDIFDHPEEDKFKSKDDPSGEKIQELERSIKEYNRLQYQNLFCSVLFLNGG